MAAYVKNYSGIWVPGAGGGTPITAATLNNLENQYNCAISMIIQSTTPSTQAFGDAAVVGVNTDAARSDHKHAMPASPGFSTQNVVTGSRLAGTVYQNTSIKPMMVMISISSSTAGATCSIITDSNASPSTSVGYWNNSIGNGSFYIPVTFIVLPGNYYKITLGGSAGIGYWTEWV